jgi:TonB family protein
VRQILLFLLLALTLPAADVFDTMCRTKGPVLGRVLETEELVRQSSHCAPPRFPALGHQARIQGVVSLTILVDREGKVTCAKLITGHPLLVESALEAARKWTFRPMTQRGRPVSFFGHLDFQFSLDRETMPAPCIAPPGPRGSSPGPALRARN